MYKAKRAASLKVKRRVGKYELGRTIGEGTFAKVRFAKNMETGDHVAIRICEAPRHYPSDNHACHTDYYLPDQ